MTLDDMGWGGSRPMMTIDDRGEGGSKITKIMMTSYMTAPSSIGLFGNTFILCGIILISWIHVTTISKRRV